MTLGSVSVTLLAEDGYDSHRRFLLSARGNALLQVLNGRRLTDGFIFPGTLCFDHRRFPSHYLVAAYDHVLCE